jgi:hypothetical protein
MKASLRTALPWVLLAVGAIALTALYVRACDDTSRQWEYFVNWSDAPTESEVVTKAQAMAMVHQVGVKDSEILEVYRCPIKPGTCQIGQMRTIDNQSTIVWDTLWFWIHETDQY